MSIPSITALATVATMLVWCTMTPCQDTGGASASDRQRILTAVTNVRRAILTEDAPGLLANISKVEGLACTDTNYSQEKVAAYLRDRSSHLYISLFDTAALVKRCGREYSREYPAISERDFLRSARETVQIDEVKGQWVTVRLTSPVPTHYPRQWYFHWESGAWKLASGSLVIGHCSCG